MALQLESINCLINKQHSKSSLCRRFSFFSP
jgi:hypothetical protein